MYRGKGPNKEHENVVKQYIAVYGGDNKYTLRDPITGHITKYLPDIKTDMRDVEVELAVSSYNINVKSAKWDKTRLKTLVLYIKEYTESQFDEIIVYDNKGNFIPIKQYIK